MSTRADEIVSYLVRNPGIQAAMVIVGEDRHCVSRESGGDWKRILGTIANMALSADKLTIQLPVHRSRVDALRFGSIAILVAREANHPVQKSANRIIRKSLERLQVVS